MSTPDRIKRCILKESVLIRELLTKRWKSVGIEHQEVVSDARKNGIFITEANLSRYLRSGNIRSTLTTDQIMWLCDKWGIILELKVYEDKNFSIFKTK
jgi:hypothetical protein